jgi:hypothetical protein
LCFSSLVQERLPRLVLHRKGLSKSVLVSLVWLSLQSLVLLLQRALQRREPVLVL